MVASELGVRNESDFARRPRGRKQGTLGGRTAGRKAWREDSRASPVFSEGEILLFLLCRNPVPSLQPPVRH